MLNFIFKSFVEQICETIVLFWEPNWIWKDSETNMHFYNSTESEYQFSTPWTEGKVWIKSKSQCSLYIYLNMSKTIFQGLHKYQLLTNIRGKMAH